MCSSLPMGASGPVLWQRSNDVWRLLSRLSPRRIDFFLRLRTARQIPKSFRARFLAMRIPEPMIDHTLGQVRGLDDWMTAWNQSAQQFLNDARREDSAGRWFEAAVARRHAAMCFHAAHFITDSDPRTVRTLKANGVAAFAQATSRLMPETRRIAIPWRTAKLPAYVSKPVDREGPHPLVVLLNGATTTKEELLLWTDPFLERGIAVITLDWPGTGEASNMLLTADCDDITDGLIDFALADGDIDPNAITLLGFSLGGSVAIRAAALDRRIAACIAVTPPYEPRAWIHYVNPIVRQQLMLLAKDPDWVDELLDEFSLAELIGKLRCPLLVFGAGRDLVVPPEEALHLAAATGDLSTLVWYPNGSHGVYEYLSDWTELAATWIAEICPPGIKIERPESTQVEAEPAAILVEPLPDPVITPAPEPDDVIDADDDDLQPRTSD